MINDQISRILFNFFSEFLFSTTIFLIFRYFSKVYRYNYLRYWSWSWLTFSLYLIVASVLMTMLRSFTSTRLALSFLSQVFGFFQIAFLLFGTYELTNQKPIEKKWLWRSLIIILVISLAVVIPFSSDPQYSQVRSILRLSFRYISAGIGFIICSVWLYRKTEAKKKGSLNMLCVFMILFGAEQIFLIVGPSLLNRNFLYDFGLVELFMIFMIGLSMVMWLLEQEREKLSKINKELDSFLYSVSHDLRAPIASVLGLTNLAKIEVKDETSNRYFEMIDQRVKKLDAVISDILHLSRSTKAELRIEPIPFDKILADVISDLKFLEGAPSITLRHQQDAANIILADYNQMKIILGNLISNAVKYHDLTKPTPFIAVSCKRAKGECTIIVEDNGQGIEPENHQRIFEMFFRASIGTEGTGLGLYIVKEAVNKLKGEVSVVSSLGKGSVFTVIIPQ